MNIKINREIGKNMAKREDEFDRFYDMFKKGYIPKPVKILVILISLFFGPLIEAIEQISKRSK